MSMEVRSPSQPYGSEIDQDSVPDPRLGPAAREFEAAMMKELVAPMNQPSALFEDGGGEDTGVMGEYAAESLARALSSRGGLGIAERIEHAMGRCAASGRSERSQGLQFKEKINAYKSLK